MYTTTAGATASLGAIGVVDDSSAAEGDAPTSVAGLLECRCSGTNSNTQTVPTELLWEPVDRKRWFYTYPGASGSDVRLVVPGFLFGAATASGSYTLQIDFSLVFAGAVDTGAT